MRVVWVALLAGGELRIGLRRTVLLLLLRVMVLRLGLRRKGILAAGILLLRRVQPHRSRRQRWVRVTRFMLVWWWRPLLIEGLRWRRLLLLRRQWCSIRARRRSLLEQRRREATSLAALVLTRRATRSGIVVEHIAEVHDGGASRSKNDEACRVFSAGRRGVYACGATTRTRSVDLITHPGDGDARSVCDSGKNGNSLMVWLQADGQKLPSSKDSSGQLCPRTLKPAHSTARSCHGYHLRPPATLHLFLSALMNHGINCRPSRHLAACSFIL
jgi:hypothetical protein